MLFISTKPFIEHIHMAPIHNTGKIEMQVKSDDMSPTPDVWMEYLCTTWIMHTLHMVTVGDTGWWECFLSPVTVWWHKHWIWSSHSTSWPIKILPVRNSELNDAYLYDWTTFNSQSTSAAILWANKDRTCFCGDDQTYHPMKKKH